MTDRTTLLPPNASPLERALEQATARVSDVATPIADLWDPANCPAELLPWLAWALSVDRWDSSWPEATKRTAIAASIDLHRHKGSRYSVDSVLAAMDDLAHVVEWWETAPRAEPHTFDIILPLDGDGGARASAPFAEEIVREIARVKPVRSHMRFVQALAASAEIGISGAARFTAFVRSDAVASADTSQPWALLLQDENGEPLVAGDGAYLENAA